MFGRKAKVDEEALNNLLWLERTLTNSKDSLIAAERHAELPSAPGRGVPVSGPVPRSVGHGRPAPLPAGHECSRDGRRLAEGCRVLR